MPDDSTTRIQQWLDLLQQGDDDARERLLDGTYERLLLLTQKMLKAYPDIHSLEETDEVLHSAALRLRGALVAEPPASLRDFLRLAAAQIRRELLDLARHYQRRLGGAWQPLSASTSADYSAEHTDSARGQADGHDDPNQLALWAEFHGGIAALPEEEREVFELLWYHGLTRQEAAAVVGVPAATVKHRWQAARRHLYQAMGGRLPG